MTTKTYRIPGENLSSFKAEVDRLNKKVEKLIKKGYPVTPILVETHPLPEIVKYNDQFGIRRERIYFMVAVTGEPIKANGWEFVATLQHEEGGTIVRAVPGLTQEGELNAFREAKPACNHCGYDRKRNDTFILRKTA